MAKKSNVKYKRVDKEDDEYKRVLVKFNPSIWTGTDFEIEFIPLIEAYKLGEIFVTEIDSMSNIDLYRWAYRHSCLTGIGSKVRGYIPSKGENMDIAKYNMRRWRKGEFDLDPRHIVSRVKRVFEEIEKGFNEPTAFTYSHFLFCGEFGSLPPTNVGFDVEGLKHTIEEIPYPSINTDGDVVERPLVRHLLDTHKTKYVVNAIVGFLNKTCVATFKALAEFEKKHRK